ncbi:lantibiotic dehydratase C-terminal domain-containing protein [Streptomyces triculaminicus]|uniref:lantibiotic dehydratase C-terminal domain-containing protein n=1 Tax=Streptomyces triculaminicus TaxID=2816232 RepID=UPI003F4D4B54
MGPIPPRRPHPTGVSRPFRGPGAALSSQRRSVLLSVLHMHHNRLVGPDRQTEGRALALARCLADAEDGRRRYLPA